MQSKATKSEGPESLWQDMMSKQYSRLHSAATEPQCTEGVAEGRIEKVTDLTDHYAIYKQNLAIAVKQWLEKIPEPEKKSPPFAFKPSASSGDSVGDLQIRDLQIVEESREREPKQEGSTPR
ncbi:hypothetical protein TWF481_010396 [Arthrobotrys musiformis]|uniref:Uncharacterized protein n=1 Tax=Arthrobotrys musiformis TaxID=47236 RepID=A0AAV9W0M2_9PEZI